MATHLASADESTRGAILIKDGPTLIAWIWSFDIASVGVGAKHGDTQISVRDADGLWFKTSATVADVHRAITAASVLYYSSDHRRAPRRSA